MGEVSKQHDNLPAELPQGKTEQTKEVTDSKEVADKPVENTKFQESTEKQASTNNNKIDKIGQWARKGILKAEERVEKAEASKRKIIQEAAKKLESMIPTNTIAMRLAEQLRGLVSDRYIRECLEDKYKQEYRAENAKKQVKKKLAEPAPLEKQEESAPEMVAGTNGTVFISDDFTRRSFAKEIEEAVQALNRSTHNNAATQLESDNRIIAPIATFHPVSSGLHKKKNEEVHIFSFPWNAINDYVQWIFRKHGSSQEVHFHIAIDKKTRQPITAGMGDPSKSVE